MKKGIVKTAFWVIVLSSCGQKKETLNTSNLRPQNVNVHVGESYFVNEGVRTSELIIINAMPSELTFVINSSNGANVDSLAGVALLKGGNYIFKEEDMILTFNLKDKSIIVSQKGDNGAAIGIIYEGIYSLKGKVPIVKDSISFISSSNNKDLQNKAGANYNSIYDCFSTIDSDFVEEEEGVKYSSFSGFVEGLGTIYESVILEKESRDYYFAALVRNDTVFYYTNDAILSLNPPTFIIDWTERMNHSVIIKSSR